jgi:hypothetical protein
MATRQDLAICESIFRSIIVTILKFLILITNNRYCAFPKQSIYFGDIQVKISKVSEI